MSIPATFINDSQFSVDGNQVETFRIGTRIVCQQGVDGELLTDVSVVIYNAGDDETVITTELSQLTANLTTVLRGWTFVDTANEQSNLAKHDHSEDFEGGEQAFSGFTDANKVTRLNSMASVGTNVSNFVQGIDAAGTGVEKKAILGTANQITVTHGAGTVILALPQDFDEAAVPTLGGIVLAGKTGVLIGNGSSEVTAVALGAGQVVRKELDGSGFEAVDFALESLNDITWGTPAAGQSLVYDAVAQKVKFSTVSGGGGVSIGTVLGLISALGGGGGSGGGETSSHASTHIDGAGDAIDGDKIRIDFSPYYYTPQIVTDITDATPQLTSHLKGIESALGTPDPMSYVAPIFDIGDTYVIVGGTVPLYAMGYRFRGKYEKSSSLVLDNVGGGELGYDCIGGKVNNSWYSVFMNADGNVKFLPMVRVNSTSYSGGYTNVYLGAHDDHTTAANGFITANDQWNTYRLIVLASQLAFMDGHAYTIYDTVNTTGDYVQVAGDITSYVIAGDWLMLVYPSTYDCLYLGMIRVNGSGNVDDFVRRQSTWNYYFRTGHSVDGNKSASAGNTLVSMAVPPNAEYADFTVSVDSSTNSVNAVQADLYYGTAGSSVLHSVGLSTGASDAKKVLGTVRWKMTYPSYIRNRMFQDAGAATNGSFIFCGFSE